jgi:hypothetical protein
VWGDRSGVDFFRQLLEISRGLQEAAAIPTEEFAVDQPDGGVGEKGLYFEDVFFAEGVGFGGEQDEVAV